MESIGAAQTPVILISGMCQHTMAAAAVSLQWDLPNAVAVRHEVDPEREVLLRVVSDASGVLEKAEIDVEHACVNCAIREDVVPTLERLAADGRWGAIIAQLPVTAEAIQVCRVVGYAPEHVPHIRISASLVALSSESPLDDMFGDELIRERGLPVRSDDDRGMAEVTSAMVEYADVVATDSELEDEEREVLIALTRPGVPVLESFSEVDGAELMSGLHEHDVSEAWVAEIRRGDIPQPSLSRVWMLDFSSDRPFHPRRLHEAIATLGGGPRRSRGCFWLPSRPDQICIWDGAGGQLSIGSTEYWGRELPLTRIVVVGLDDEFDHLHETFVSCLLSDTELASRGRYWEVGEDGFEPWLGPIRRAA